MFSFIANLYLLGFLASAGESDVKSVFPTAIL